MGREREETGRELMVERERREGDGKRKERKKEMKGREGNKISH